MAVIPARGGSKRLPRKNIRQLGLKPLLAYSILSAKAAHLVDRVVVSTDDDEIAQVAELWGAEVHRRRWQDAGDQAPIETALWRVAEQVGEFDWMVTLQPTVPLRPDGLIDECIKRAAELECDSVFSAQALPRCWFFEVAQGGEWADTTRWRRMAPPQQRQWVTHEGLLYKHDGSVCVSSPALIRTRDRMGGWAVPYLTPETVDIDTEADLAVAEAMLASRKEAAA